MLAWVVVAVTDAAVVGVVGTVAVVACWLAFNAVGVVVVAGDLRLVWLRHRSRIAVSYS